jgi:hypothetical protein
MVLEGVASQADAAFPGDQALIFENRVEGFEEAAGAFTSCGFKVLLEVPQRFGVGNVVAKAQAEKLLKLARSKSFRTPVLFPASACSCSIALNRPPPLPVLRYRFMLLLR